MLNFDLGIKSRFGKWYSQILPERLAKPHKPKSCFDKIFILLAFYFKKKIFCWVFWEKTKLQNQSRGSKNAAFSSSLKYIFCRLTWSLYSVFVWQNGNTSYLSISLKFRACYIMGLWSKFKIKTLIYVSIYIFGIFCWFSL